MKRVVAIALSFSLILPVKPVKSQAQLIYLAPGLCATGAGCLLVGIAVVGSISYAVWKSQHGKVLAHQNGHIFRVLEDPEEEMGAMGRANQTEPVIAGTRANALKQCVSQAKGRRLKEVKHFRGNQWECIYY